MEIFTNAPSGLDYPGSKEVGELGMLRIVSVSGTQTMAEAQRLRYMDRGFFAAVHRNEAVAFVTQKETLERPSGADIYKQWKEKGSIDLDNTMPIE